MQEVVAHEGTKGGRTQWLGSIGHILTTGFTRQSEREVRSAEPYICIDCFSQGERLKSNIICWAQIRVWDPRNFTQAMATLKLDVSSAYSSTNSMSQRAAVNG